MPFPFVYDPVYLLSPGTQPLDRSIFGKMKSIIRENQLRAWLRKVRNNSGGRARGYEIDNWVQMRTRADISSILSELHGLGYLQFWEDGYQITDSGRTYLAAAEVMES